MRRRVLGSVVAGVAGVALLLSGCSDDETGTSPARTTTTAPSPSPTPSVPVPAMPPEALAADADGAAAFIRHYFDLMNYAYATGDLAPVQAIREPGCSACRGMEEIISDGFAAGRHIEGGLAEIVDVAAPPEDADLGIGAVVVLNQNAGRIVDATGGIVEDLPAEESLVLRVLVRHDTEWEVVEWGAK